MRANPIETTGDSESAPRFYLPQLDGLRFLAFLLVFFHHGPRLSALFQAGSLPRTVFAYLETFGWCGVDLFLVLSAYLITSLLLIEYDRYREISLRDFYLRRMLRIWPLYYLMIGIGFLLAPWLQPNPMSLGSPQYAQMVRNHLLPYLTLFGNYSCGAHGYPPVYTLAHLWTVTLEEQFYVVWPLLLAPLLRVRRDIFLVVLPVLLTGTIVMRAELIGGAPHPYIWTNTLARLDPFVLGIAVALWRHVRLPRAGWLEPTVKLAIGSAAVASISLAAPIETQSPDVRWQFLATATGFALILDAVLSSGRNPVSWLLSRRPLVWLGKLTYGLYVYHIVGLQLGASVTVRLQQRGLAQSPAIGLPLWSLVSLLVTVLIATASYRFFELFFLRLKERVSHVKSRPVEQGADHDELIASEAAVGEATARADQDRSQA